MSILIQVALLSLILFALILAKWNVISWKALALVSIASYLGISISYAIEKQWFFCGLHACLALLVAYQTFRRWRQQKRLIKELRELENKFKEKIEEFRIKREAWRQEKVKETVEE